MTFLLQVLSVRADFESLDIITSMAASERPTDWVFLIESKIMCARRNK